MRSGKVALRKECSDHNPQTDPEANESDLVPDFLVALTLLLGVFDSMRAGPANDQAPKPGKSGYTLFNPAPMTLMRDFNTDRPDQTENPFAVNARYFQIELRRLTYSRDHYNSDKTRMDQFDFA